MIDWTLNPDYATGEAVCPFSDIDRVFALDGELITHDSLSRVLRVSIDGKRYYVKRYTGSGKNRTRRWFGLRRWLGPPRVRAEWQNLLTFRAWGIPTATVVAYGLERRCGAFTRGAVVTEEIPDTMDLAQMNYRNDPRLSDRRWVAEVSRQIADIARTLHAARFAHNDLKWRNLLVDGRSTVYLIEDVYKRQEVDVEQFAQGTVPHQPVPCRQFRAGPPHSPDVIAGARYRAT